MQDRGGYLLIIRNPAPRVIHVGALGEFRFGEGWYVYAGSAMGGLQARIRRHFRTEKKLRWHIDYLVPAPMALVECIPVRSPVSIEHRLAAGLEKLCFSTVPGFGASDSPARSHLFNFTRDPRTCEGLGHLISCCRPSTNQQ
jgi:sugar fermentation stimulation protein A